MRTKSIKKNKINVVTLGCSKNIYDSEVLMGQLKANGKDVVHEDKNDEGNIVVINTCGFIGKAKEESIDTILHYVEKKESGDVDKVFVTGCLSERYKPDLEKEITDVDQYFGTHDLPNLLKVLEADYKHELIGERLTTTPKHYAYLKIAEGCDRPCSFCAIPLMRGKHKSTPIEELVIEAKKLAEKGIKEIVLTGVNIGDYGKGEFGNKKHEHTFLELVKELDKVEGIHRLRISSIEPNLLKDETIDFVADSKTFVPHFHIPLQSGSDDLLKLMKRRYLRDTYTNRVHRIKQIMPNACIGVDVIVGFPGETDEHFLETYNYLNDLDISYLHVFTYSERPNTEAVLMDGVVAKKVRAKRSKMLRGLSVKKRRAFYESQIGNSSTVLFESENKEGYIHGFTENYVKVKTPWNPDLVNTLQQISLTKIDEDGLVRFDFINELISSSAT